MSYSEDPSQFYKNDGKSKQKEITSDVGNNASTHPRRGKNKVGKNIDQALLLENGLSSDNPRFRSKQQADQGNKVSTKSRLNTKRSHAQMKEVLEANAAATENPRYKSKTIPQKATQASKQKKKQKQGTKERSQVVAAVQATSKQKSEKDEEELELWEEEEDEDEKIMEEKEEAIQDPKNINSRKVPARPTKRPDVIICCFNFSRLRRNIVELAFGQKESRNPKNNVNNMHNMDYLNAANGVNLIVTNDENMQHNSDEKANVPIANEKYGSAISTTPQKVNSAQTALKSLAIFLNLAGSLKDSLGSRKDRSRRSFLEDARRKYKNLDTKPPMASKPKFKPTLHSKEAETELFEEEMDEIERALKETSKGYHKKKITDTDIETFDFEKRASLEAAAGFAREIEEARGSFNDGMITI